MSVFAAFRRVVFLAAYGSVAMCTNIYGLMICYGFVKSAYMWKSIDRNGKPVPWFTYPAIEYLTYLDLSAMRVFEYGSGNSTLFFSKRCRQITSVEDDPAWWEYVEQTVGDNGQVILEVAKADYIAAVQKDKQLWDIIVIDGSHRRECAVAAARALNSGGLIIVDDADGETAACEVLRREGLIEVDFHGFGPINGYTKTTAFFLDPSFRPRPASAEHPPHSIFRRA